MYEKHLKGLEEWLKIALGKGLDDTGKTDIIIASKLADLIIKIKTIQAMDVSAELIRESRKILGK